VAESYWPVLHLYAQDHWHDEGWVVGTRPGLEALQTAISQALQQGTGKVEVTVNDGEGYDLCVILLDEADNPDRLTLPYGGVGWENDPPAIPPWRLWLQKRPEQKEG